MSNSKDFKFTMKTRTGKTLVEQEVRFGNEDNPWPEDWKESGMAMMAILNYEEAFIAEHIEVIYEEMNGGEG